MLYFIKLSSLYLDEFTLLNLKNILLLYQSNNFVVKSMDFSSNTFIFPYNTSILSVKV